MNLPSFRLLLPVLAVLCGGAPAARAWTDLSLLPGEGGRDAPRGGHVLDGSYVMNIGELQINITNHGLIGSQFTNISTFAEAPSGQWPAGSGNEYLWGAGLWIGGILNAERRVTTGQPERELRPLEDPRDTIYEARQGRQLRPAGNAGVHGIRRPDAGCNDDGDLRTDEETLDGRDDDGDGLEDEDFAQLAQQMLVCTMYDNTPLSREVYPDHRALNLKVVQTSFGWDAPQFRDFVGFRYNITNIGAEAIRSVYVGMYVDCDIGPRDRPNAAMDDLTGFYEGMVRATDGTWSSITMGYMYDGAESSPLPGYFGVLYLGPPGATGTRIRSYRHFAGQLPYESGGSPINDEQRYTVLSGSRRDAATEPWQANDYRFLASVGPWSTLAPGGSLQVDLAMVVGDGLEGLLLNAAEAVAAWRGRFYNLDNNTQTGTGGRETLLCFPGIPAAGAGIYMQTASFMDESCVGENVRRDPIMPEDFTVQGDGRTACIWVNQDNCEECDRITGQRCTSGDRLFEQYWRCNRDGWWGYPPQALLACTGVYGAEGRIPWVVERYPPPPPGLRVVPGENAAHIFWNDDSEHAPDVQLGVIDFESYRVWRSDDWDRPPGTSVENGPESTSWQMIAEYDVVSNFVTDRIVAGVSVRDTVPLGRNTGLAGIAYRPVCLDNARFAGLGEAMAAAIAADTGGLWTTRPALRDAQGMPLPELAALMPWEAFPAELDTFFDVVPRAADPARGIVGKRARGFYEHVDREVHNGFLYFYSVTATDQNIVWSGSTPLVRGAGLSGAPNSSFTSTVPGTHAQTAEERQREGANIFVYPNPATRARLAEFQRMHPNATDPTGERVMFANLPACVNRIAIFTEDGDLVQEVWHDGTTGTGEASWNLVSRNGQEVVSGIYLYAVEPRDGRFARFIGKFVVIR